MFIAKKHVSRRAVLRGVGVTLGLPFLDSMVPAQTPLLQTAASPASRLACIEMVHGAAGSTDAGAGQHLWSPEQDGSDFDFSYSLESLAPFRDYITIVSGTDARQAEALAPTEVGADHFRSSAVFLTAAHPKQTAGPDVLAGISIDQLYAQRFGQIHGSKAETPLPSIQLGIEHVDASNSCGFSYNCIYSDAISWSAPGTPLPPVINPREALEILVGKGGHSAHGTAQRQPGSGIVDAVLPDFVRLQNTLGPGDRSRMSGYVGNVRDIERRIEAIEKRNARAVKRELYTAPLGVPDSWEEHVKLMFDLQVLAFASEATFVSTFKMSHDVSNRVFAESGVRAPFHTLSHHDESPSKIAEFAKLNRYHVSLVPYFLEKLKNTPDGDGSLLDHALVLYGSPMGDSQTHNHRRVPLFLAGHACGRLKGNLHRACEPGTPQANALLTVLHKLGMPIDRVGDNTGEVDL
jgi:hypothetical protein